MTNTQEGMTQEQSMLGKYISGCMFPLCLETPTQIKVKTIVPPGAIALENKAGLWNTSLFAILIQGYPDKSASRVEKAVNLIGVFKQFSVQN